MSSLSGVGVIDKSAVVLAALRRGPLDLAALAQESRLPRATAHRLAVALEFHGLVRRDVQGRFCLGFELMALGRAAAEQFGLAELAGPVLASLRDQCGESVQLFVREDGGRRCVVSLHSPHALRWIVPEGSLLPLGLGSAGRVLTEQTKLPRSGWIESVEEREPGVASVSAPIRDAVGSVVAAVSVSGPIERMSRSPGRRLGAQVVTAADLLSQRLAGRS